MNTKQFVTFKLGQAMFGVDILLVKEINRRLAITPVFDVADFVVGTANLRGQVITILDPAVRLGLRNGRAFAEGRVLVLKTEPELTRLHRNGDLDDHSVNDKVGLMVDSIGDVLESGRDEIHPVPANLEQTAAGFAAGVVPTGEDLVVILRLERLLALETVAEY